MFAKCSKKYIFRISPINIIVIATLKLKLRFTDIYN